MKFIPVCLGIFLFLLLQACALESTKPHANKMIFFETVQTLTNSFPWTPEKVGGAFGITLTLDSDNTDSYVGDQIHLGGGIIIDDLELRFPFGSKVNPVLLAFSISDSSSRITYEEVKQKYPKIKFFGGPEPDSPLTTSFAVKESWGNLIFTFGENDCLTDVGFQNKAFFDEKN